MSDPKSHDAASANTPAGLRAFLRTPGNEERSARVSEPRLPKIAEGSTMEKFPSAPIDAAAPKRARSASVVNTVRGRAVVDAWPTVPDHHGRKVIPFVKPAGAPVEVDGRAEGSGPVATAASAAAPSVASVSDPAAVKKADSRVTVRTSTRRAAEPAPLPPAPQAPAVSSMPSAGPMAAGSSPVPTVTAYPAPVPVKAPSVAPPMPLPVPASPTPAAPAGDLHTYHQPAVITEKMPASRWEVFEKLGLKAPSSQQTANFLVNAYRLLGFSILTIIVVVLVGYIATTAFYFVSDSWVQPMVVSSSDEKVLSLESQVAEQENTRDRLEADLAHADRYIAVQQAFQSEFAKAIRADLSGRRAALGRVRELARDYAGARKKIRASNQAYASASQRRMQEELAAGLIDRSDMLSGKYQIAQITGSNLSLAERQVEFESRAQELATEAQALDAILSKKGGTAALSYDVLRIKQEYEMSRLETAKAIENREALKASLVRQEAILEGLRKAPYLRAANNKASVAFVPYDNLDGVGKGEPLYRCALEFVLCREAGKVVEVLPGEVTFKHPHREKIVRGRLVEIDLGKSDAAQEDVLFVGGRPLLI
jgi:hypothetical protein